MSFFGKIGCSLGIHKWDRWVYATQTKCDQKASCLRCSKEGHRFRHDWGDWTYIGAASCVQVLKCSHCGESQSRTVHNWSDWAYTPHDNRNCLKERTCIRCRGVESKIVSHSWSSWREHIFVVEGFFDCIHIQRLGFDSIALMGTTISQQQISLLKLINRPYILMLDGDFVGQQAMEKIKNIMKRENISVMEVYLEDKKEPESLSKEDLKIIADLQFLI